MQIKQNADPRGDAGAAALAFSRRQTLRPQVLDLGDALSDLTMLLRRLIGRKGETRSGAWPRSLAGQGRRLAFEQVIVNLAVNAAMRCPTAAS